MYSIQQFSTRRPLVFFLTSAWDPHRGVTGATPQVQISKAGGAFAPPQGSVIEIGEGAYKVAVTSTDTDTLGPLLLVASAPDALPCRERYDVVNYDPDTTTTQTGDSFARLGEGGSNLTAMPWTAAWTAAAKAATGDALTAYHAVTSEDLAARSLPASDYARQETVAAIYQDTRNLIRDPRSGRGVVAVDHDYGGPDALAYRTEDGRGVDNAVIQAFLKTDYDAGRRDYRYIQGTTSTNVYGRWVAPLMLDPAEYTLVFFKQGSYSPTITNITVTEP